MDIFSDSFLYQLVGLLTAIAVTIYVYFTWTFQYWKNRGVPYLEPSIPYGNVESKSSRTASIGEHFAKLYKEARAKGWRHCGVFIFAKPFYLALDLNILKLIMTKDFQHFVDRGSYVNEKVDPISAHLFAIGGSKWRNLRVKLTPAFTSGKLKSMFQTLVDCASNLEGYVEERMQNKGGVDIKEVLANFSTDVIGSCAFGLDCNSFKDENSPFRVISKKALDNLGNDGLITALLKEMFPNFANKLGLREFSKEVNDFYHNIVSDIVSYREKTNSTRKDLVQLLIDLKNNKDIENEYKGDGKSLTLDEIVAQCFVFFIAGFETSSTTMTFALYELAKQPDIQDKVRREIEDVLGKHNNDINYDSLSELKYMKQVIDETLRKYPPVPVITRVCVEDYKLPGEDIIIEKGTEILISIMGIHYDEKYYKNPTVFDPNRFSEENRKNIPQYAHIPFGEGPRICIGERFGIMQTKIGLTTVLRKFRVSLNEKTESPLKLSMTHFIPTADKGIWLDVEKL